MLSKEEESSLGLGILELHRLDIQNCVIMWVKISYTMQMMRYAYFVDAIVGITVEIFHWSSIDYEFTNFMSCSCHTVSQLVKVCRTWTHVGRPKNVTNNDDKMIQNDVELNIYNKDIHNNNEEIGNENENIYNDNQGIQIMNDQRWPLNGY